VWFGDNAVNVSKSYYGGFDYGTCHKPNRQVGTGFSYAKEQPTLNIESAKLCAAMVAPSWASAKDRAAVKKWTNVKEDTRNKRQKPN